MNQRFPLVKLTSSLRKFYGRAWLGKPLRNICVKNDHGYVPLIVNTFGSFPHSWLITEFVTRVTRWVPLVEQELLTLPKHLSSPPVFSGVRVTRSLVLYVYFVDRCVSFSTFSDILKFDWTHNCTKLSLYGLYEFRVLLCGSKIQNLTENLMGKCFKFWLLCSFSSPMYFYFIFFWSIRNQRWSPL